MMNKRRYAVIALCLALVLSLCAPARAESFAEKMGELGEQLGKDMARLGEEIAAEAERLSEFDLEAYIKSNETLNQLVDRGWEALSDLEEYFTGGAFDEDMIKSAEAITGWIAKIDLETIKQKARDAGQSLKDYWPVFKQSVKGSVDTIFDSDMTRTEKLEALKHYGILALPFLAERELDPSQGENAEVALEALKNALDVETDQEVVDWIEKNGDQIEELKAYLEA